MPRTGEGDKKFKAKGLRNDLRLARENDVLLGPGVDLLAMGATEPGALDLGVGPQFFFNGLTARRQFGC
jgi:hypothetical protein